MLGWPRRQRGALICVSAMRNLPRLARPPLPFLVSWRKGWLTACKALGRLGTAPLVRLVFSFLRMGLPPISGDSNAGRRPSTVARRSVITTLTTMPERSPSRLTSTTTPTSKRVRCRAESTGRCERNLGRPPGRPFSFLGGRSGPQRRNCRRRALSGSQAGPGHRMGAMTDTDQLRSQLQTGLASLIKDREALDEEISSVPRRSRPSMEVAPRAPRQSPADDASAPSPRPSR
jgi:hypothetical protein